jgi:cell division transport system permease protein
MRVASFSRRRETSIMRLVGASNAAIRLPFVLEAAVSAFGGGVFASLGLVAVKVFLIDGTLASTFRFTTFIGWDVILQTLPVVIGTGVLLAVVAASVTLRRYLRV